MQMLHQWQIALHEQTQHVGQVVSHPSMPTMAPEINPSAAASGLLVLVGALCVVTGRRRARGG